MGHAKSKHDAAEGGHDAGKVEVTKPLPELKLMYLPVRARAEPTRLALTYAKIPFEDITIGFNEREEYKVCIYLNLHSPWAQDRV